MKRNLVRARRAFGLVAVGTAAGLVAACEGTSAAEAGAPPESITLDADSSSNPTVAIDPNSGTTYLAWVGTEQGQNAVFVSAIDAEGSRSGPVRANDVPGDAAPHLQAPAQVAIGPAGEVYVLWQNNTPVEGRRFPASDLRMAVSTDGARTFGPAITVNDDAGGPPTSHTFHDLAVSADGTVYVSWIDSRERDAAAHQTTPLPAPHRAGHGGAAASHSMHQGASPAESASVPASHGHGEGHQTSGPEIRMARSLDGGRSFTPSVVVDTDACPCCRTSLALGSDGSVYVAWRKLFPGDVRDIVVVRSDPELGSFSEPVRVHHDEWVFPACPHAGPSLALDDAGRLLVGWYTGREGRQGLWYAVSEDGGGSFSTPAAVLTGDWVPPSQLRLAVGQDRVWAVWDDRTGAEPRLKAASGAMGGALQPVPGWEVGGGDPAIAAGPVGAVVAWLSDGAAMTSRMVNSEW